MVHEAECHKDTAIKYLERMERYGTIKRYKVRTGGLKGFIYIWVLKELNKNASRNDNGYSHV